MRIPVIVIAALLLPAGAQAQAVAPSRGVVPLASARLAWVSCRVIAPATLQLIWSGNPGGLHYEIDLTSTAGPSIALDTTADTTFTRASLPAGSFRIAVKPLGRVARPLSATARTPLRGGSTPCGGV